MVERAKNLYFTGTYDANGQPLEYFAAVPARDLDESDIQSLSDEQYADITSAPAGRKPLYQKSRPSNPPEVPDAARTAEQQAQDQAAREREETSGNQQIGVDAGDAPKPPKK